MSEWRDFILGKTENPGIHEEHFYNLNGSIENSSLPTSSNIHRYLQRSVAIDVVNWGPKFVIVYAKFPGLILTGFINVENRNDFRDTKIHVKKGVLNHSKITFHKELWDYINTKADLTNSAKNNLSKKQKEKINLDYEKMSPDEIITSGTFQALHRDIELSGIENVYDQNNESDDDKKES